MTSILPFDYELNNENLDYRSDIKALYQPSNQQVGKQLLKFNYPKDPEKLKNAADKQIKENLPTCYIVLYSITMSLIGLSLISISIVIAIDKLGKSSIFGVIGGFILLILGIAFLILAIKKNLTWFIVIFLIFSIIFAMIDICLVTFNAQDAKALVDAKNEQEVKQRSLHIVNGLLGTLAEFIATHSLFYIFYKTCCSEK